MTTKRKMLQAAAGQAGGAGLDITEVFSTYLYDGTGTGSNLTVTNNIDLSTEGGLVWVKNRDATAAHALFDTVRGQYILESQSSGGQDAFSAYGGSASASYNTNGFGINGTGASNLNQSGVDYASWTFRKAPKFFDVVTYTGDGNASKTISHSLGSTPGFFVCKPLNQTGGWRCFHRSTGNDAYGQLNENYEFSLSGNIEAWAQTSPTDTNFTVGISNNTNNINYVAYLFAHNDGDGGFGPDGDQDIIKCGSYTGTGATDNEVDLGFEPQWLMIKRTDVANHWYMFDTMRGITSGVSNGDPYLRANLSNAEGGGLNFTDGVDLTATGFELNGDFEGINANGGTYIYMAIRRGPLAQPESGTEVFAVDANGGTSSGNTGAFTSGFPVDLALYTQTTGTFKEVVSRLNSTRLFTNLTNAENATSRVGDLDFMDGFGDGTFASDYVGWMWKRAPGYFDVVAYSGNSTAGRTVSHNLGVAPEMMWVKHRNASDNWAVYHKGLNGGTTPENYYLNLDTTAAENTQVGYWNNTAPTASNFTLGTNPRLNDSAGTYIAYLFATVAGVSKVGSYTGTGATLNIDCGFTSGARFVLIKSTNVTGNWIVYDTARGIVSSTEPALSLNTTDAELTGYDLIDPQSGGFTVVNDNSAPAAYETNANNVTYIFYAIA